MSDSERDMNKVSGISEPAVGASADQPDTVSAEAAHAGVSAAGAEKTGTAAENTAPAEQSGIPTAESAHAGVSAAGAEKSGTVAKNTASADQSGAVSEESAHAGVSAAGAEKSGTVAKNTASADQPGTVSAEAAHAGVSAAGAEKTGTAAENTAPADQSGAVSEESAHAGISSADTGKSGTATEPSGSANPKKRRQGIFRIFLFIFISLFIGLTVYSWNAERLAGNAMPMPFGFGMSVVLSGSMEPELSVNDLVIIAEADVYEVGDTVVYQSENILIIHEIIETDGVTVVTKGTANNIADDPISVEAVKGKLVGRIPSIGLIVRLIRTPVGIVVILAAAFLLLRRSYRREKEQDEAELDAIKDEIRRLRGE